MQRYKVWDAMVYGGLLIVLVWTILKSLGIINTPVWLEIGAPIVGTLIGFYGLYQRLLDILHDIRGDIRLLSSKVDHMNSNIQTNLKS